MCPHVLFPWQKSADRALECSASSKKHCAWVLLLWQQYLDNILPSSLYDILETPFCFLLLFVWHCFVTMSTNRSMLALIPCMDELVAAHSDSHRARKMLVHDTIYQRQQYSEYHRLVLELLLYGAMFQAYSRLTKGQFELLLQKVGSTISRESPTPLVSWKGATMMTPASLWKVQRFYTKSAQSSTLKKNAGILCYMETCPYIISVCQF